MEQNPKPVEAAVIANDAVSEEATAAPRKPKKRVDVRAPRRAQMAPRNRIGRSEVVKETAKPDKADKKVVAASKPVIAKRKPGREAEVGNGVRAARIERMMSKAELARRAGLSVLTIDRVEKGLGCRMDTKRKILEALGLSLADRVRVFGEEE
jgi:DNA-binding XRE family transcriptional regulator